jgi:hypothetical protein
MLTPVHLSIYRYLLETVMIYKTTKTGKYLPNNAVRQAANCSLCQTQVLKAIHTY